MAGEIICKSCQAKNNPGAILCESCSEPLEVSVGTSAAPQVVSPATVCILVEGGKTANREFELPQDDFEFQVGRNDLDQGIIPDVDLTKFADKVTVGQDIGYTVSRRQAIISRRMGRLYLRARGGSKTLVRQPAATAGWVEVKKDEEVELQVGSRFRFGGSEGYVIFEVK